MIDPRSAPKLLLPFGLAAALFALVAAKCEHNVDFPGFVVERCDDNVDNDEDGKSDCADLDDCQDFCRVEVEIDQPTATVESDTLLILGSHRNAKTIAISVAPSGTGGTITPSGDRWQFMIRNIGTSGPYTITAVANGPSTLRDTATVTFQKP